ncbi:MAG: RDD family protein [Rickettsiales bacterium]|nr:RDD family protein [Rickettsiales bacterium]
MTNTYASFWRRILAFIIDGIFFSFLFYAILKISHSLFYPNINNSQNMTFFDIIFLLCIFIIPVLFTIMAEILFISSPWQTTPGKKTLRTFIGHKENGVAISRFVAFARILLKYLVILLFFMGISLLKNQELALMGLEAAKLGIILITPTILNIFSVMFGKEKLTVHDFVCTTRVFNQVNK